jgi:hypothetical protein
MRAQGRLTSPEEFGNIIVRELPTGGIIRVRVTRIELGTQGYTLSSRINGKPVAVIAVYQLPGTNAVHCERCLQIDGGSEETFRADEVPDGVLCTAVYTLCARFANAVPIRY